MSKGRKISESVKNWECSEPEKLPMLLFIQRIRELLLHTTSIASKPLVASPLVIAREILFLLQQHSETPHTSTQNNLNLLVKEFEDALSNDLIAKKMIGDRLENLIKILSNFSDARYQLETARYLIGRLAFRDYTTKCAAAIIEIVEGGGKKKQDLLSLCDGYIAAIKEVGYPTQTIYHLLNVDFLDYKKTKFTARQRLEKFFSNFDFEYHKYIVHFGISEIAVDIQEVFESVNGVFSPFDGTEYNSIAGRMSAANRRFFLEHAPKGIITINEIEAFDPQSARVVAERRLRLLDDVLRFSVHRRRFTISNQALVWIEKTNQYVNSNRPKSPIFMVPHESSNGVEGLNGFAKVISRNPYESMKRFVRAIELHGTALSAQEDESQLLNLWIALETLFVTGRNGSKIKEIIDALEPYVSVSWNQYLFGELWERIEQSHLNCWNSSISQSPELQSTSGYIQFVMATSIRKFEPYMTEFLRQLDDDPLLRQKIFACIKWSQNALEIQRYMKKISHKVACDINRIYRTRNQIVHTGGSMGNLSDVVQLAHHYLDLVLTLLAHMLGEEKGCKSIEQANIETKVTMDAHLESLKKHADSETICETENYFKLLFGRVLLQ